MTAINGTVADNSFKSVEWQLQLLSSSGVPRKLQMLATSTVHFFTQIPTMCDKSFDTGRRSALARERVVN
jgi:hypothetical protein